MLARLRQIKDGMERGKKAIFTYRIICLALYLQYLHRDVRARFGVRERVVVALQVVAAIARYRRQLVVGQLACQNPP